MSYESKLNNQSSRLINPAQLCLLLSVILHLLVLKFGLPTIRFNRDAGEREVSLVELNPEQQSRLPNLYPQLENLDPAAIPELNNVPPADNDRPAAPFAIPADLIPGIGDNSNLAPLTIPPPPQFDLGDLPPQTDITLPPVGDFSDLPLPPALDPSDFKVEPIKLPPDIVKTPEKPKPSNAATPQTAAPEPQTTAAQPKPEAKPEAKPAAPPQKPETEPKETPEQIAARRLADSQQRIRNLAQSLTKTEVGTTDEEARKNYVAWLAKIEDVEPENIEIEGTYPRDACIRRLKGTSVFGAVVDTEGKVVSLDLIKGAEYPIFNQQASNDLGDRTIDNDTERPKPYQVTVNYEYDPEICPSLTLPSLRRKDQPEPEPKTTPAPEAVPEPEPEPEPKPKAQPLPSLRDRLRNIPLPDRKPADLKDIPLPERENI